MHNLHAYTRVRHTLVLQLYPPEAPLAEAPLAAHAEARKHHGERVVGGLLAGELHLLFLVAAASRDWIHDKSLPVAPDAFAAPAVQHRL